MGIAVVINAERETFERAKNIALAQGTTLTKLLTQFVERKAEEKVDEKKEMILEVDALAEIWCAARGTLWTMRQTGELKEGEHYVTRDGLIFYYKQKLRDFFAKNYPHIEEAKRKKLEKAA